LIALTLARELRSAEISY